MVRPRDFPGAHADSWHGVELPQRLRRGVSRSKTKIRSLMNTSAVRTQELSRIQAARSKMDQQDEFFRKGLSYDHQASTASALCARIAATALGLLPGRHPSVGRGDVARLL